VTETRPGSSADDRFLRSFPLPGSENEKQTQPSSRLRARARERERELIEKEHRASRMDWNNVTTDELVDALRQVDWKARPRPLVEMFRNLTYPRTGKRWRGRLKCNLYYYRTNYFGIVLLSYVHRFYLNPGSLVALVLFLAAVMCLNDNFANLANDKLMRVVSGLAWRRASVVQRERDTSSSLSRVRACFVFR